MPKFDPKAVAYWIVVDAVILTGFAAAFVGTVVSAVGVVLVAGGRLWSI